MIGLLRRNPVVLWATGLFAVLLAIAGSSASGVPGPHLPRAFRLTAGPLTGRALYASPHSQVASAVRRGHPSPELTRLAAIPQGIWLTGGTPGAAAQQVRQVARAAQRTHSVPVFVVYDIPRRDCGSGQSGGGAPSARAYRDYVSAIAFANRGRPAIVVLEPDALAQLDCVAPQYRQGRYRLLKWAVGALQTHRVMVYLDAGNRGWHPARVMAERLSRAGILHARGFAVNVSNFDPTRSEIGYGRAVSGLVGWKRFVIDTSRNGTTPRPRGWCNPPSRAVGPLPGTNPHDRDVDALLWIKAPGESDGVCGTSRLPAGQFDRRAATRLMRNAGW
ncbi:MAG TPA: glycoside hydrolase family 6 protein [Jatrophihabitantaceae bacterium]|nr:glycoside hydrolase family 6 protein [Jatrophihabitantaceae bacterium]